MTRDRFIAFDLGAESGRAVVGTLENSKLSLAETHRFANPTGKINGDSSVIFGPRIAE